MTDRQVGNPIDLDVVEKQREQTAETIGKIQDLIQGELTHWLPMMGKLMLGSDTKVVVDERGRRQKVPVTMADINEHMERYQLEVEEEARQVIVKKAQFALETQEGHFGRSKSESRFTQSQQTVDFTRALIARFQALPLPNCGWEWQEKEPTFSRDEKTLQEFCDITLEGTPAKYSDRNADLIPSAQALDNRNPSTWDAVVRRQGILFKKYIEEITIEKAVAAERSANVASRFTRSGTPLYSQEKLETLQELARKSREQANEVSALQGFREVLPYFQRKLVTFHSLLIPKS